MNCQCERRVQEGDMTILELQEALLSGRLEYGELGRIPEVKTILALKTRLERVRSWGGAFGTVDFSGEVKEILGETNRDLRPQQVAL